MKVVSLKQSEQQPDAARAALRAAILTKSKADAAVTTASAKLEAARTLFSRTEEKLSAAVAAIDDAKNEDAEATAMGAGAVTTAAIRKQRQKVADLEDEVAVCAGAKTKFEAQLAEKISDQAQAAESVIACRNEVIEPTVHRLADRLDVLRRESIIA